MSEKNQVKSCTKCQIKYTGYNADSCYICNNIEKLVETQNKDLDNYSPFLYGQQTIPEDDISRLKEIYSQIENLKAERDKELKDLDEKFQAQNPIKENF